jgi:lactate dehydrogenase-like 2-hydroxyacid dehydrogenase
MTASAGGCVRRRGRETIISKLLEDCAKSAMIIDVSRDQCIVRHRDFGKHTF